MAWEESQHPRILKGSQGGGQFTHAAGTESEHPLMDRMREPGGGFTYNPTTDSEPSTGMSVSIFPERSWSKDAKSVTPSDVESYVIRNIDLFRDSANHLGGWHDPATGTAYLDVSRVVRTHEEARSLAMKHDQIAYYDLSAGKTIVVNRDAKSGGAAP